MSEQTDDTTALDVTTGDGVTSDTNLPPNPTPPASTPAAMEDQAERTRLGRKVARMEQSIAQLTDSIQNFLSAKPAGNYQPQQTPDSYNLPETIATADDVRRVLEHERSEQQRRTTTYQNSYRTELFKLGETENLHDEIVQEMMTRFNIRHTDIGAHDARYNYALAKASLLERKHQVPGRPPVTAPLGTGVSGTAASSARSKIQLSDDAAKFARQMGYTDDKINKLFE